MRHAHFLVDGTLLLLQSGWSVASEVGQKDYPCFGAATQGRFLASLRSLASPFQPAAITVVWDGGRSKRRMGIYPQYKAQRTPLPPEVKKALREDCRAISGILLRLACRVLSFEGREADDVLAWAAVKIKSRATPFVISDDRDLVQLVALAGANVIRQGGEQLVSALTFADHFGSIKPEQYVLWRAIQGDRSDGISGVPGVGPKRSRHALKVTGASTVKELGRDLPKYAANSYVSAILAGLPTIERNIELIDLSRETPTAEEAESLALCLGFQTFFDRTVATVLAQRIFPWLVSTHWAQWSLPFRSLV